MNKSTLASESEDLCELSAETEQLVKKSQQIKELSARSNDLVKESQQEMSKISRLLGLLNKEGN